MSLKFTREPSDDIHTTVLLDPLGYRITFRDQVCGVKVPPRYHAHARVILHDGSVIWDFAGDRRPFKTMNAAEESCEKHLKIWTKIVAIGPAAGNITKARELFDKLTNKSLPTWVVLHNTMKEVLFPCSSSNNAQNRSDLTIASTTPASDGHSATPSTSDAPKTRRGRASTASAKDGNTTRTTRRARSKVTETSDNSSAAIAEEPATVPKKRSKRTTTKSSLTSRRASKHTTNGSDISDADYAN